MPTKEQFGANIKQIRERKGYTVRQVAMWADLNPATVSMLENGKRNIPKVSTITKLAKGLREPVNHIIELAGYIPETDEPTNINNTTESKPQDLKDALENDIMLAFDGKPISEKYKRIILELLSEEDD